MRIQRILSLLLAALLLLAPRALAAEGDANLLRDDAFFQEHSGSPYGGCAAGGAIYLYTDSQIYVWHPDDAQPAAVDYALPGDDREERAIARLFPVDDQLFALCTVDGYEGGEALGLTKLEIRAVNVDGGAVSFGEAAELDAGPLTADYGGGPELCYLQGAAAAGGKLYLDAWIDGQGRRLCAQSLDGGAGEFLDVENLAGIAACGDQLLVETFEAGRAEFLLLDPESGSLTPACAPLERDSALDGLAYSAESGRLFYLDGGYVMAAEGFDFDAARPVAELMTRDSDQSASFLLPGDRYVCIGSYGGISMRATDGELPETQIVVQGGGLFQPMIDAYYDFNAGHSDAMAVLREDYSDDAAVLNDIMSRDDSVDVRITMASDELYEALRERGYLAPLDDAGVAEEVSCMYPAVQEALKLDGKIVAMPVYVGGWTMGFDAEGFAKLGIDDMPDSWPEFLDLLPTLPELLPEDGSVRVFPDYNTQVQIRTELVGQLLDSWLLHLRKSGEELRYDDPTLAELLDEIMALDLDALGVSPGSEGEEYYAIAVSDGLTSGERSYTLVNTNVDCTLTGLGYNMPAMLSIVPGEEAPLPLDLAVVFVNPFSRHIELAQEYAALACKHLDEYDRYSLDPSLSEPVPRPEYERWVAEAQARLDAAKQKLEGADEADAPRWENEIAQAEKEIADLELNRWKISPEKIEWYRAHGERLMVREYSYVDVTRTDGEFSDLVQQFMAGRMDASGFLREIDRRVQMRRKEG